MTAFTEQPAFVDTQMKEKELKKILRLPLVEKEVRVMSRASWVPDICTTLHRPSTGEAALDANPSLPLPVNSR